VDTESARKLLDAEEKRLAALREGNPEDETPAPGDVADQGADAASRTFNREVNHSVVEQAEAGLEEVAAARRRLDEGAYGVCEVGGEQIPDARLEAQPATRHCVEHQQQVERQEAAGGYEGADPTV
jgi:RNA polymerase-binding transcription factor DksA